MSKVEHISSDILKNPFWGQEIKTVAASLKTNLEKGLSEEEAVKRLTVFGANKFGRDEGPSLFSIFLRQFGSPLIVILLIASAATILIKEWADASVIILAVMVNVFLGFYQENKAERAIADLRSYIQKRARVIRDGLEKEVDASLVVPGDLIHISQGMRVPADTRLASVNNLMVDEAILTGESLPVAKKIDSISEAAIITERKNMLFGGTLVAEGSAHAVVTGTGLHTEIGKLSQLVGETRQERTPLQKAVSVLAWAIAIGTSLLVTGIFALGTSRGEPVFDMLIISIAVVVGAIPEALPIGLTAVLAVGIRRIAHRRGIIRNLIASETLGSTTTIMVDKTGTLTEANMKLTDIILSNQLIDSKDYKDRPGGEFSAEQKELLRLAVLNTDVAIENPHDKPEQWRVSGRALEANIVSAAVSQGLNVLDSGFGLPDGFRIVLPFSSAYKFSVAKDKMRSVLTVMGAPDVLLDKSNLSKEKYVAMRNLIEEISGRGRRVLGIAIMKPDTDGQAGWINPDAVVDLEFAGVLVFHDPVRENIPETMDRIEKYGVRVVMATGDLKGTAVAVANEIGWKITGGEVLTGEELERMNDADLLKAMSHVRVFARVTPEDKLRIVRLYQKSGEVVAMTGDGVNDAPSLKAADIGVAVGSGSDVAKGVADLVLLDDKLNTIVTAIEEGKRMLLNIKKIFVYLMSNALDEVVLIGGSLLAGLALPLSAIQIIWVNLFTGSLPAVAFAFDKDGGLVRQKKSRSAILDNEVKFLTIGTGVLTSVLLFVLYWLLLKMSVDVNVARNVLFACFASYILVVAFSIRNLGRPLFSYPLFDNKILLAGITVGLALVAATIYLPLFQNFFGTMAIAPRWLFLVGGWLVLNVLLVEGTKWLFYRKTTTY